MEDMVVFPWLMDKPSKPCYLLSADSMVFQVKGYWVKTPKREAIPRFKTALPTYFNLI